MNATEPMNAYSIESIMEVKPSNTWDTTVSDNHFATLLSADEAKKPKVEKPLKSPHLQHFAKQTENR